MLADSVRDVVGQVFRNTSSCPHGARSDIELEVEDIIANEPHVGADLCSRDASLVPVVRLQSWPIVDHQKQRKIITARSLERYERLYNGYKRRSSSYKGCSGPRSGTVYEVHLLAHETPVWTRPALHPHSRQRSETPCAGRVNEQVYVCPRGPRPKAKRVGPTQSRGDGRLSILNRYSFCRGQKNRNRGRTIERSVAI